MITIVNAKTADGYNIPNPIEFIDFNVGVGELNSSGNETKLLERELEFIEASLYSGKSLEDSLIFIGL